MPFLILRTGPAKGASWVITEAPLTIGREPSCDVHLPDPLVSRRHCQLALEAGTITLRDLGSSNATFVNGDRVQACSLKHGDEITLGSVTLHVTEKVDRIRPVASPLPATSFFLTEGQAIYLQRDPLEDSDGELPQRASDLARLCALSRSFSRVNTLNELLSILANAILEHFKPQNLWIALGNEPRDSLRFVKERTYDDSSARPETAMHRAYTDLRAALIPERLSGGADEGAHLTLIAPIHFAGRTRAVLALSSRADHCAYDETDLHFLVSLANIAGPFFQTLAVRERLQRDVKRLRHDRRKSLVLIGESPCMQRARETIHANADTLEPILVSGEAGTGRSTVAALLHELSERAAGPFVHVDCASIPDGAFQARLFGHEDGACPGSSDRQIGFLEQADGGTLFLDGIDAFNLEEQEALLGALESRSFRRFGGAQPVAFDARVIAASREYLEQKLSSGSFRSGLYEYLRGVEIVLEPLRARPEDIPSLARHFLDAHRAGNGHKVSEFDVEALEYLRAQSWPGNVRGLRDCIEAAAALSTENTMTTAAVQAALDSRNSGEKPRPLAEVERLAIENALEYCDGHVVKAAKLLGIGKDTLYRRLAQYRSDT